MARADGQPSAFKAFFSGVGLLGQGLRLWATAPKIMWLGVVPALLVAAVYLAGIILLAMNLESIAALATPFAENWDEPFRTGLRIVTVFAFLAVAILLLVYTFTAITLVVGDPFYERIWRHVESKLGEVPVETERGFWRTIGRGIGDALRLLFPAAFIGLGLFALGFVPLVGQVLAPVLGALVGGWFLTVELTGLAFDARGFTLRQRRQTLRRRRAMSLGFGAATYLLFLIPFGAVLAMPAAVAGATLLSRKALGESERHPSQSPGQPNQPPQDS
jgi:CysZ protein